MPLRAVQSALINKQDLELEKVTKDLVERHSKLLQVKNSQVMPFKCSCRVSYTAS
jgi:hypothetical protein